MDFGLPANEARPPPPASGRSVPMREGVHMRNPMRRYLFALIAGLSISAAAVAADKSGSYTTFGAGNKTCESWLKEREKGEPRAWQLQQWLLGYVSAYNNWVHKGQNVADGTAALAAAIQGTDFFPVKVTHARRGLFSAAAVCFPFPMIVWLKIAGAVLLALAWGPCRYTCARKQADGHYGKRRPPSRPLPGPYRIMTERPRARYARDRRARPAGMEIQDIKVIGPERSVLTFIGG